MKRDPTASLSLLAATFACGLCAACTERQLISHPAEERDSLADSGESVGETPAESAGDDGPNLGNFPEPAITECGGLPAGVDPIPGLSTAWAVSGNAPGIVEGVALPDDAVRLRFADRGIGCDESFAAIETSCADAWAFGFSLPLQDLQPGVYDMASLANLFPELYSWTAGEPECAGGDVGGGGGSGVGAEPQGELEIFSINDDCIVGEFRGLLDALGDLDFDRNGGFIAMRCQSDCVPVIGNGCGE